MQLILSLTRCVQTDSSTKIVMQQPQFITTERKIIDNNHKKECAILCRSELSLTLTIGHFR